jgi:hypothetical protein
MESVGEVISGNSDEQRMEIGFKLLNSICKSFIDNVQFLFFTVALLIACFLFRALPNYSPLPQLSVIIYFGLLFFQLDMIVIRQGIAVAVMFYAYKYVENRQFLKFLIFLLVASWFHISVIILIPSYFFVKARFSTATLVILFAAFHMFLFFRIKWISPLFEGIFGSVTDSFLVSRVTAYMDNSIYSVGRGINAGTLANIFVFAVSIANRRKLSEFKYFNLFFNLFILYIFVYCCMGELIEISSRFKYYFMISVVVLLPMVVMSYKRMTNRLFVYAAACGFAFVYIRPILLESPPAAAFNPYQNYIIYAITNKKSTGMERLQKSDDEHIMAREKLK